ncbi:SGNH/GDSL hydrolase family protein [Sediminibacillus massiliensis]|uniref:SGNH/GDSL hydrolase family protein n=1 Tax=Sediminibacillus massiliensis TaxID=1926277 RepID=UPI001FEA7471|nr:SGNH/GDSL hydrolase family protein [Sediminibacillus massiliensis]
MRKKRYLMIILSGILLISLAILTIYSIYITPQPSKTEVSVSPSIQEDSLKEKEEIPEDTELQEGEGSSEGDDIPITEEIKERVSQVVESAIGLFIKKDLEIVAIGDSLTQGVGDTTNNGGYVGIIENTLNDGEGQHVEISNYGKRGNRSDQLLKRLDQTEIAASISEADLVLVTIGANDIMKVAKNNFTNLEYEPFMREQEHFRQRLRSIIDKMLDMNPETEIYLIGFYNPFQKYFSDIEELSQIVEEWNGTSSSVALEYDQVHYIPTSDLFHNVEEDLLYEDNFHPNATGYKLMAERVLEYIRPEIERAGTDESEDE